MSFYNFGSHKLYVICAGIRVALLRQGMKQDVVTVNSPDIVVSEKL